MFEIINLLACFTLVILVILTIFPPGSNLRESADKDWVELMTYITASFVLFYCVLVGVWTSIATAYNTIMRAFN